MNSLSKSNLDSLDPMAKHKTDFIPNSLNEGGKASVRIDVAVQVTPDDLDSPVSPLNIEATFKLPLKRPTERLKKFQEIGEELTKAASRVLLERRTKYDHVKVLSIYWRDGEYPEMKENAEAISRMFKGDFSYKVTLVDLPAENPGSRLLKALGAADELSKSAEKNLLILYYCGHGVWDRKGTLLKPHKNASVQLKWEKFQSILTEIDCDILLIFDCCQATAMVVKDQEWKRRCEIIGATNRMDAALADRDKSFTNALLLQLRSYVSDGIATDMLYSDLSDMETMRCYKMERQPDYQIHSNRNKWPSSIFLQSQGLSEDDSEMNCDDSHTRKDDVKLRSLEQLTDKTDAVMLFAVILEGNHSTPRQEDWDNMINAFSVAPPNTSSIEVSAVSPESYRALMKLVKIPAVFSGSCIIIMAMPVWFYSHLEPNPSYHEIAIVRSDNLWAASRHILIEPYRVADQPKLDMEGIRRRGRPSNPIPYNPGKSTFPISEPVTGQPPEYEEAEAWGSRERSAAQVIRIIQDPEQPALTLEQFRALIGMRQEPFEHPDTLESSENEDFRTGFHTSFIIVKSIANWIKNIFESGVISFSNIPKEGSSDSLYASVLEKERNQRRFYSLTTLTKGVCQILQLLIAIALIAVGFTSLLAPLEEHRALFATLGVVSWISIGFVSYITASDLPRRTLQYANRLRRFRDELEDQERDLRAGLATVMPQDVLKLRNDYAKMVREEEEMNNPDIWNSSDSAQRSIAVNDLKFFKDLEAIHATEAIPFGENRKTELVNIG